MSYYTFATLLFNPDSEIKTGHYDDSTLMILVQIFSFNLSDYKPSNKVVDILKNLYAFLGSGTFERIEELSKNNFKHTVIFIRLLSVMLSLQIMLFNFEIDTNTLHCCDINENMSVIISIFNFLNNKPEFIIPHGLLTYCDEFIRYSNKTPIREIDFFVRLSNNLNSQNKIIDSIPMDKL